MLTGTAGKNLTQLRHSMDFEKNVPIPENYDGPRNNKYNYHKMEIGDSYAVVFEPTLVQKMLSLIHI